MRRGVIRQRESGKSSAPLTCARRSEFRAAGPSALLGGRRFPLPEPLSPPSPFTPAVFMSPL